MIKVIDICIAGESNPDVMLAADQVKVYVDDILRNINKVNLPADFNKAKLMEWVEKINKMQAWEHLSANEGRQLRMDMESLKDNLTAALEARGRR